MPEYFKHVFAVFFWKGSNAFQLCFRGNDSKMHCKHEFAWRNTTSSLSTLDYGMANVQVKPPTKQHESDSYTLCKQCSSLISGTHV